MLGQCKLTGVVGFVPANVTAGFLACIGWKVMKKALEVASGVKMKIFDPYYLGKMFGIARGSCSSRAYPSASRCTSTSGST